MKTQKTQQEAFRLLRESKLKLIKGIYKEKENLSDEIKIFLSKDDNEVDVLNDCMQYLNDSDVVNNVKFQASAIDAYPQVENITNEDIDECPMNNLKNRMKSSYPQIFKTLDFDFLKDDDEALSIYQEFKNAFLNYNFAIYLNYDNYHDVYKPFIVYNGEKNYIVKGNFEFEQTAQMACIEKCFEIIDELGLHLKSSTFLDKFEDWHSDKEIEHLEKGTEFTAKEIFDYFKPFIDFNKVSKFNKKYY